MNKQISQTEIERINKKLIEHLKRDLSENEFKVFEAFIRNKNIVASHTTPSATHAPIEELANSISELVNKNVAVDRDDWIYNIWAYKF